MQVKIDPLSYSRERDYNYGRSSSNSDIGGKRDDKWTRRDSSDHVRDKQSLSRERDQCPHRRCKRSRSSGHDDRQRSRSPQVCTHSRSHQDNYGKDRHDKSEGCRNRDYRQSHEHSSVTPTATVEVKGLSEQTTEENIHQILAEWRPFLHVRVMRKRRSSVCRGVAFIDFPSVAAAQKMMDVIGDCGLDVNGQKLSFEYRSPQVCTCSRSHQDNYGKDQHNKSEGRRNRDDRQSHEHSSVTPTATVEVKGLSGQTTEEIIHQILAEWRPFLHVRLMRRRKSSVCRGIAFIDFPSVAAAQKMMDVVGDCGLDVNGQKLSFGYRKINDYGRKECAAVTSENIAAVPIVEELKIGNLQPDSSSDCISTSISQEDLEELIICIKKDPYLEPIVEDIEIGGPIVMMRYLNDSEVLYKLGQAMGFGVSGEVDT